MGSKLFLLSAAIAGVTAAGPSALAQSTVERCRAMATDAERFACLEDALAAAEAALAAGDAAPVQPAPMPGAANGREGGFRIPFLGGGDDDAAASPGGTGLGAEQVARPGQTAEAEEPRARAIAVSYDEYAPGQWQFDLDSGEVWRQTLGDTSRLALFAGQPLPVEIWRSWAGGYRMRLIEQDRTIQVQRVR